MNLTLYSQVVMKSDHAFLVGIIPPLVTPLEHGRLDVLGLERLIEYVLCAEVAGLFVLGTTGEGPSLSGNIKRLLIRESVELVGGRVPVVVGVSDPSLDESIELAAFASDLGAAAVASTPPFYFPASQPVVAHWYEKLADASPLPLILYNFPSLAKVPIDAAVVDRLMEHPRIIGIKDSSGDLGYFERLCAMKASRPGWRVWMGPEEKLADAVRLGADGGVCGGANLHPHLFVDWFHAARDGDADKVQRLRDEVLALAARYYGPSVSCESVVTGLKRGLAERHICRDETGWPFAAAWNADARPTPVQLGELD